MRSFILLVIILLSIPASLLTPAYANGGGTVYWTEILSWSNPSSVRINSSLPVSVTCRNNDTTIEMLEPVPTYDKLSVMFRYHNTRTDVYATAYKTVNVGSWAVNQNKSVTVYFPASTFGIQGDKIEMVNIYCTGENSSTGFEGSDMSGPSKFPNARDFTITAAQTQTTSSKSSSTASTKKTQATSTSQTTSSSKTVTKISDFKIPEGFQINYDISKLPEAELKTVKDLELTVTNPNTKVSVMFKEPFDFTDQKNISVFQDLNKYIATSLGSVSIGSESANSLNKKAKVTFFGISVADNQAFKILKDGVDVTNDSNIITNVTYDKTEQTISFDVSGFSKYEVSVFDAEPAPTNSNSVTNLFIYGTLVLVTMIVGATGLLTYLYFKKGLKIPFIKRRETTTQDAV